MRIPWPKTRRERAAWGAVALAGGLALGAPWLELWRPPAPDRLASFAFRVTTGADDGPGSLREAILAADHATGRTRIVVAVPKITLAAPLPPLVNPHGVVVEAGQAGAELDGTRIAGPILDIASAGTTVSGLRIVGGSAGLVVRAAGATLRHLDIVETDTGVLVGEGAGTTTITDSTFARNRIGIQVLTHVGMTLQNGRFADHQVAAVWAVAEVPELGASQLTVVDSHFHNDAIGLVVINRSARVERNRFDGQQTSAVHVSGGRSVISDNTILAVHGFGIYAERLDSGLISRNQIARSCNGGMLLRDAGNTQMIGNKLYQNAYGVVLLGGLARSPNTVADNLITDHISDGVLLIGSSPIVNRNSVLRNRSAGLRLSALTLPSGVTLTPAPLLTANVLSGNGLDEPQRDQYVDEATTTGAAPVDCAWRLGLSIYAVQAFRQR